MARKEPEKEATLREVLAEVSLVDFGRMLKGGLSAIGCWSLFFVVVIAITSVSEGTGYDLDALGVPSWFVWLLLVWFYVYIGTADTSYHEWKMSWYFPRLNWLSSLVLAAYLLGFVYLMKSITDMEAGLERGIAFFLVWFGYTAPFALFFSVVNAGHSKLMEKRRAAGKRAPPIRAGEGELA